LRSFESPWLEVIVYLVLSNICACVNMNVNEENCSFQIVDATFYKYDDVE